MWLTATPHPQSVCAPPPPLTWILPCGTWNCKYNQLKDADVQFVPPHERTGGIVEAWRNSSSLMSSVGLCDSLLSQCFWSPLHSWLLAPFKSLGMEASVAAGFPVPSTPGKNLPVPRDGLCSVYCHSSPKEAFQNPSVQSFSRVQLFATPWTAAQQASLSITNSQSLLKLISIELVRPS